MIAGEADTTIFVISSLLSMHTYITCNAPPWIPRASEKGVGSVTYNQSSRPVVYYMDISEPVGYTSCEMEVCNTVIDPVFCARSNLGLSADF